MKLLFAAATRALLALAAVSAHAQIAPLNGAGNVTRTDLTYAHLMSGSAALVDYAAYAVPTDAANPDQNFQGTLTLENPGTTGNFTEVGTRVAGSYSDPGHLPAFSFRFIQDGTHIFPMTRGLIPTSHPNWNYILEPGRVWKESNDHTYNRAAIPFSLQEKGANCTHNGVLTFLFKSDGAISKVAYQIAGETCSYFNFDLWGLADATYTPQTISNAADLTAAYEAEVNDRMPAKPISALATDFPGLGVNAANIGSEQTSGNRSVYGVATNGVNYVGGCETRKGTYPYCAVLDVPSYSLAKSMVGAIGLMRVEKKYKGTQKTLTIGSEVARCGGRQWSDVTLLQALDMATGNYDDPGYEVDEGSQKTEVAFFVKNTYDDKATHACAYARKATPGSSWVYHTSDTLLLGAALNNIVKHREGSTKDVYTDILVSELWKPLKMSPTTYTTLRTADSLAYPLSGYGLTLHHDDLVKVGEFLNKNNASINGAQMLDSTLYNEAMHKTANHGLRARGSNSRYLHGFWAWNASDASTGSPLCGTTKWIPYMSGFGGIGVVLLPNNMVYYFVSDKHEYGFKKSVAELNKIRSICS
jgi:hypothetical protein